MKRLLSIDEPTKKYQAVVQAKQSVTCIEDFSNEIFYDIFDYLDACDIFDGFFNLNKRFQEFFTSSSYLLKIYRYSTRERTFKRYCKKVILPNKQKIISINLFDQVLINSFCISCRIDSSFNHLESIVLNGIKLDQLLSLLIDFIDLSRLFSLKFRLIGDHDDLDSVYQLCFQLPFLKFLQISLAIDQELITLRRPAVNQLSTIKYLKINHECTFHQLSFILSYTPALHHLTCQRLTEMKNLFKSKLFDLTYLSIKDCENNFDGFEIFIKQISMKLRVIHYNNRSHDSAYLDADRWERLISEHVPNLSTLNFQFSQSSSSRELFTVYHTRINQFMTSFWIKRQWIFSIKIDSTRIFYSIHSDRKNRTNCENSTNQNNQGIKLTLSGFSDDNNPIIFAATKHISSWIRINYLHIDFNRMSIMIFSELIHLLPNVTVLKITTTSLQEIYTFNETQLNTLNSISRINNITNISIGLVTDIEQVTFFIRLLPHIKYLEVNCANNVDVPTLLQAVLMENAGFIASQLSFICFCVGQINEEIIQKLQKIIVVQPFPDQYTIECVNDKIYLQRK